MSKDEPPSMKNGPKTESSLSLFEKRVDECRHAEHVREEDKLLAERGRLAGASKKVNRAHPFVRGEAARHKS
jgi:hypothetical protein